MQAMRLLINALNELARPEACVFTLDDLRSLLPGRAQGAFKTLLSRAVQAKHLQRLCRGLYLYERAKPKSDWVLPCAVRKLRPLEFNYLSLETVLSDAGIISQVPIQRLMVMSSARSSVIHCGQWGSIEFIKTKQLPADLVGHLTFDGRMQLWRASVPQALRDMRATHRSLDLIDWSVANEYL